MPRLNKEKRRKRLESLSVLNWTKNDFEFMGYYTRKMLASNGDPMHTTCNGKYPNHNHKIDLDIEDSIIYLVCTGCKYTKVLSNKVEKNVQTHRTRETEWKFRPI